MIIYLKKSQLFNVHPDRRFALKYNVPSGTWNEMWRRYKLLRYTHEDMLDYLEVKTTKRIGKTALARWLWRSEVFSLVHPMMQQGVESVVSSFFGEYEDSVMKELLKNIKSSVKKDTKVLP